MGLTQKLGTIPLAIQTDSSNNVGIGGAANASYKLAVTGASLFTGALTATGQVEGTIINSTSNAFRLSGNNALSLVTLNSQSVVKINAAGFWGTQLVGANDQGILITNTGNVGIGTSSPQSLLDVSGSTPFLRITDTAQTSENGLIMAIGSLVRGGLTINYSTGEFKSFCGVAGNSYYQTFLVNGSERMRITSGGWLKVSNNGTYVSTTSNTHEINTNESNWTLENWNRNANPYGIRIKYANASPNNTGLSMIYADDSTALRFELRSNGGVANYQGNNVNLSDIRTKKDVMLLESYWDKFKAIEIVKFKYNDQTHDDFNIGVIAQQLEEIAPEFVDIDGWGETPEDGIPLKSIYTADLHHATIKVLQEAMAKIEELSAKVTALENK